MKLFQVKFMIIVLRYIYSSTRYSNETVASAAIKLHNELEVEFDLRRG